jgi:hypothetical protein
MKTIKIFCEGITDQIFIADCLESFYKIEVTRKPDKRDARKLKCDVTFRSTILKGEIIAVDGCGKLTDDLYIQWLKDNTEEDGINLVIFDADFPKDAEGTKQGNGNKGFKSCTKKLEDIKQNYDVIFDYHVWPNHKEDGDIENLLLQLIPNDKKSIFDCIESNQICLQRTGISNLRVADLKQKIGYYLYAANQKSEPRERNYQNADFWNLDWANIPDLFAFKVFLTEKAGF